jgi:hypothetical protein
VEEETGNDSCNAASERIDFSFLHGEVYKPVKKPGKLFHQLIQDTGNTGLCRPHYDDFGSTRECS